MTCNPYWEEVGRELFLGQTPQDCPELVERVYRSKLRNLHDHLIKKKHFGEVLAYAHVIEFQKRGLPHEHFLLVMANRDKLRSPDEFDKYISVEIPDKDKFPVLDDLVCKHMMHGPCGVLNDKCACMQNGSVNFGSHDNSVMRHRWVNIHIWFIGGGMMGKLLRLGMQS
jgi:hypothetical protein